MFDYLCYFQTSTFFCSKETMLRLPFTKGLPFFQDIDWFLRAMRDPASELVVVARPLSIYHAPENRISVTSGLKWKARVDWGAREPAPDGQARLFAVYCRFVGRRTCCLGQSRGSWVVAPLL